MDWQFAFAVSNLTMAAILLGAAAFVLRGRKTRVNVHLAIFLATEGGIVVATGLSGLSRALGDPDGWVNLNGIGYYSPFAIGVWFTYLAFLGVAVDSPLVRPFRPTAVRWTLAAVPLLLIAVIVIRPTLSLDTSTEPITAGPLLKSVGVIFVPWVAAAVALLATAAAIHAYVRAAPGTLAKRRAKAYAIAFITWDVSTLAWAGADHWITDRLALLIVTEIVVNVILTVFVALLVKALLRDQLFDFDLTLKLGVKRGTIVAVFLAAFLIAIAIAEQYLERYGVLVGGAAAGVLLFAARPIERAADRIATTAMPHTVDTPEYRLVKKRDVYRAAVEGAIDDGTVTETERSILARLADRWGLSASEALAIEREVRATARPA